MMNRFILSVVLVFGSNSSFAEVPCKEEVLSIAKIFGSEVAAQKAIQNNNINFIVNTETKGVRGKLTVGDKRKGSIYIGHEYEKGKNMALLLSPANHCSLEKVTFFKSKEKGYDQVTFTGKQCYDFSRESVSVESQYGNTDDRNAAMVKFITRTYLSKTQKKSVTKEELQLLQKVSDNCRDSATIANLARDSVSGLNNLQEITSENKASHVAQ